MNELEVAAHAEATTATDCFRIWFAECCTEFVEELRCENFYMALASAVENHKPLHELAAKYVEAQARHVLAKGRRESIQELTALEWVQWAAEIAGAKVPENAKEKAQEIINNIKKIINEDDK